MRTRSSSRKFNIRHFSFELSFVSFRFISLAYFVYKFVNCLSRAVGLEMKVIS